MQRIAASLTMLVVGWLVVSPALPAQTTGAVAGRLLDEAGGALRNVTVGLFAAEGGEPVGDALQTTCVTDPRGAWAFSGVTPGEYVVQAVLGEAVFGVAVTVGSTLSAGVLIVVPSPAAAGAGTGAGACAVEQEDSAWLPVVLIGGAVAAVSAVAFRPDQS